MSVRPSPKVEKPDVSLPVIIATIAVLIIFLGGLAFHFLGSSTKVKQAVATQSANGQWINQLAQQSGGDFSRLSPADQQKLVQVEGGQAPLMLQQAYQALKK